MVLIIGVRQDLMLILNFNWPNWKRNIKPIYPQIWGLTCGFSIRGTFINRGKGLFNITSCFYIDSIETSGVAMLCFSGITVSHCRYDRSTERAAFSYHGIRFQTTTHKSGSQEAAEVPRWQGCGAWRGARLLQPKLVRFRRWMGSFLVPGILWSIQNHPYIYKYNYPMLE